MSSGTYNMQLKSRLQPIQIKDMMQLHCHEVFKKFHCISSAILAHATVSIGMQVRWMHDACGAQNGCKPQSHVQSSSPPYLFLCIKNVNLLIFWILEFRSRCCCSLKNWPSFFHTPWGMYLSPKWQEEKWGGKILWLYWKISVFNKLKTVLIKEKRVRLDCEITSL